jgi:hypothetical protein
MSKRLRLDDVEFALRQEDGLLAPAARRLGCSRAGLYCYLDRHPQLWDVVHECRESVVDEAEMGLRTAIREGDLRAIFYTLSTLGKWRGFITAKDLSPAGQSRLPNRPDGETDESWVEALRLPRRSWGDTDDAESEPDLEPLVDWEAREDELIRGYEARLAEAATREAALIARCESLVRAETPAPAPEPGHAVDAELTEVLDALKRRLGL